jgi:tripartite-type tricarboxylate transporter receptor subunit TctC
MAFLCASLMSLSSAYASNITVILPNPPGSTTDSVFRIIQKAYLERTGVTLIPNYAPGGDMVVAVNKFKSSNDKNVVLLGTTTIHIYNHVFKDSVSYTDADFDHVAWAGRMPSLWAVNVNSSYKTLDDVVKKLASSNKSFIGTHNPSQEINIKLLQKNNPVGPFGVINYKGGPDVERALMSGEIDVAVYGNTSASAGLAESGKIRILGQTLSNEITLGAKNLKIPTVLSQINGTQLGGGFIISTKPGADKKFVDDFTKVINDILADEKVKAALRAQTVYVSSERGNADVLKSVVTMRNIVKDALNK